MFPRRLLRTVATLAITVGKTAANISMIVLVREFGSL